MTEGGVAYDIKRQHFIIIIIISIFDKEKRTR